MIKVLVPLFTGFEEIEAITIIDILRRAEVEVVTAGLSPNPVMGWYPSISGHRPRGSHSRHLRRDCSGWGSRNGNAALRPTNPSLSHPFLSTGQDNCCHLCGSHRSL
jgi:putative intracellular protease/amidase